VPVATEMLLDEMTDDVATTPFIVVVSVLPESVVVREFMILANNVETPFTILANVFVVVLNVFVFMKLVVTVAGLPFTVLVSERLLVVVAIVKLFIVFVAIAAIVFAPRFVADRFVMVALLVVEFAAIRLVAVSKLVFITFAAVVPRRERLVRLFIVVVEIIPSTVLVMRLVVDEKLSAFVVVAAMSEARDEVEITPFTLVVMIPVLVANDTALEDITDDVATTPFTVVVSTLPLSVVVREFMILATRVETPFTIEAKVLVVVERVLVFMKLALVVAITPLVILVKVKLFVVVAIDRVFVVDEAMRDDSEVVATTPFMLVVSKPVDVA
jgi:hypothetical protein